MFTFAHLSDVHLPLRVAPRLHTLLGKRLIGYLNLTVQRRKEHTHASLDAIISDMRQQSPDHIVITGDMVNLALPDEYLHAREFLESLGEPDSISLIPGNHDVYTSQCSTTHWKPYLQGNLVGKTEHWPYVHRRGPIAFIGISSAIRTWPFMATGCVGTAQCERLASLLDALGKEELIRVVLIHHPPLPHTTRWHRRLKDARHVTNLLRSHGAEIVLHGHNHTDTLQHFPGPRANIPIIGVPSASASGYGGRPAAQYGMFSISHELDGWLCHVNVRGLCPRDLSVRTLYEYQLRIPGWSSGTRHLAENIRSVVR